MTLLPTIGMGIIISQDIITLLPIGSNNIRGGEIIISGYTFPFRREAPPLEGK